MIYEKATEYDIFIDDYVSYIEEDKVIGINSFKVVDYDTNTMGQRIMVLEKHMTIKEWSGERKTIKTIHPCYLKLSEKGIRMRKLKKIDGTSN